MGFENVPLFRGDMEPVVGWVGGIGRGFGRICIAQEDPANEGRYYWLFERKVVFVPALHRSSGLPPNL